MDESSIQPRVLEPRIYEYVLAGLLLAGFAGAMIGYHVYHGFITEEISRDRAYWGIGLPFVGVAAGIYIFAYGWQRGDVEKALRMSMWLSLGVVGIIATVLGTLALKRSPGSAGRTLLGFGVPERRRRSGLTIGDSEDNYEYTWMGGTFGGERDEDESGPRGGDVFTTHCRNCGELFIPQPPKALCPNCGVSAFGRTG